jgi:phospholipase C
MKIRLLLLSSCLAWICAAHAFADTPDYGRIKHIVIIYQENWSFDGLFGKFPGADGLDQAGDAVQQVDLNGKPLASMPQPLLDAKKHVIDDRFPAALPVGPFDLTRYMPASGKTGDMEHKFYVEQRQIDGGRMDKFVSASNNGAMTMSYVDASQLPEGRLAAQYTLCDHYFHGSFGGSLPNHILFVAMAPAVYANAPAKLVSEIGPDGLALPGKERVLTPDGYVVNDMDPAMGPHKAGLAPEDLVPPQTMPTIGDRMSDKKVTWAWYSEGWNDALAGTLGDKHFTFHHQPFAYFKNYANGTPGSKEHLKDTQDLDAILSGKGELPQVAFIKFMGHYNEHPHDSNLLVGQQHSADLVQRILASPYGKDCAILITYDENGGRWDHVAPPKGDRWGPGTRVPMIVVSPFAKRGYVDHTTYTTASILKFIETRFKLDALNDRDGSAANLDQAFDFSGPISTRKP